MNFKLSVAKIVQRIMDLEHLTKKQIALQILEKKSERTFYNQISANTLSMHEWNKIFAWAVSKKIDLNWLITGKGTPPSKHPNTAPLSAEANIVPENNNEFYDRRLLDIAAEDLAVAIDMKLQSAIVYMDSLHSAISRLRQRNVMLMDALKNLLPDPEIKKIESEIVMSLGTDQEALNHSFRKPLQSKRR
jgi:hypothetical protein